jgi:acyl-CoA thioesterase-1
MRSLVLLGLSVIGGLPIAASTSAAMDEPVILVVGDSLSAGYGIDIKQGWVALLEERLKTQGYGYRVVNASVSGETSVGARGRLQKLLELHRPNIMILEIGANDGLRGLPIAQTKDNLAAMLTLAKTAGVRVVVAGMQMPPNYGAKYTQEFAAVFVDVTKEHGQTLIPFFLDGVALDMQLVQADGLHPTAAAQPRLLDNVWQPLHPLLTKKKLGASH